MNLYLFIKYGDTNLSDRKAVVAAETTGEAYKLWDSLCWGASDHFCQIGERCPRLDPEIICAQGSAYIGARQ